MRSVRESRERQGKTLPWRCQLKSSMTGMHVAQKKALWCIYYKAEELSKCAKKCGNTNTWTYDGQAGPWGDILICRQHRWRRRIGCQMLIANLPSPNSPLPQNTIVAVGHVSAIWHRNQEILIYGIVGGGRRRLISIRRALPYRGVPRAIYGQLRPTTVWRDA